MIDLTPLDVRNKRGDFKRVLRGYDPQEVDVFLELVAERLESLVREKLRLQERSQTLEQQVSSQSGRERAVQEALVTAQELRSDMRTQAQREAELILEEARVAGRRITADAERKVETLNDALSELERRRNRFLKAFRQLLERELDVVEVEAERTPLEDQTIEMDLGGGRPEAMEGAAEVEGSVDVEGAAEVEIEALRVQALDASGAAPGSNVDGSAVERPPMDVPVDELAAAYQSTEDEGVRDQQARARRDLTLPLRDDEADPDGGAS